MTETNTNKAPTHHAYVVRGEGDEAFWKQIGVAWAHSDKKGITVKLDAFPVNGELVIRRPKPRPDAADDTSAER